MHFVFELELITKKVNGHGRIKTSIFYSLSRLDVQKTLRYGFGFRAELPRFPLHTLQHKNGTNKYG